MAYPFGTIVQRFQALLCLSAHCFVLRPTIRAVGGMSLDFETWISIATVLPQIRSVSFEIYKGEIFRILRKQRKWWGISLSFDPSFADQCRRLAFTTMSYISLQFRPKHCSCLQNMNLALGVYFLLAVLYKGKFEISFGDSIIYVHSHNEFAGFFFCDSALFHGWMSKPSIYFTTNLFKGRLTPNNFQTRESQSLGKSYYCTW